MASAPLFRTSAVANPRTGILDYHIEPLAAPAVTTLAAWLRAGQPAWAALSLASRIEVLGAFVTALADNRTAIGEALARDTGRAGDEIAGVGALVARWSSGAPSLIAGLESVRTATAVTGVTGGTRLRPHPLVGVVSSWSQPLTLALSDAVPALIAGCAVIVQPSALTPRFIRPLMTAIESVPALASVLAVIEGDGETRAAVVAAVDYIAFTGTVAEGRDVAEAAGRALIPASLELGGKDPMIVLASADPEAAAALALRAVTAPGASQPVARVFVARAIADRFLAALLAGAKAVQINHSDIGQGMIGPFACAAHAEVAADHLTNAIVHGAQVLTGGTIEDHGGKWLRPTVVTNVRPDMALMTEEGFGPILPVMVFDMVHEAVALANAGVFGRSASVIAGNFAEAEAVAMRLNAGAVSINDAGLMARVTEVESSSFGVSGVGPSRHGASGLLRFFRRQALLRQAGTPLGLSDRG